MGDLGQQEPALDAAVFELTRFEARDGHLELEGIWSGVGGTRFVRPTLVVDSGGETRRLLATLEHKPWDAGEGSPWLASFPCEVEVESAELSVAPGVDVELPAPSKPGRKPTGAAQMKRRPGKRVPAPPNGDGDLLVKVVHLERERDEALEQRRAIARELEELKQAREEALIAARAEEREAAALALGEGAQLRDRIEEQRAEAFAQRDAAFAERDEAMAARVHAEEARDAAVRDRDTAVKEAAAAVKAAERDRDRRVRDAERARDRAVKDAQQDRDRAVADAAGARTERDAAIAERDRAVTERDLACQERDGLLSAHERGLPLRPPQPRFAPAPDGRSPVDVWLARGVAFAILVIFALVVLLLF